MRILIVCQAHLVCLDCASGAVNHINHSFFSTRLTVTEMLVEHINEVDMVQALTSFLISSFYMENSQHISYFSSAEAWIVVDFFSTQSMFCDSVFRAPDTLSA